MKVKELITLLDKPEHLEKEIIIDSDEEGNIHYGDIDICTKYKHILTMNGSREVELEDYL